MKIKPHWFKKPHRATAKLCGHVTRANMEAMARWGKGYSTHDSPVEKLHLIVLTLTDKQVKRSHQIPPKYVLPVTTPSSLPQFPWCANQLAEAADCTRKPATEIAHRHSEFRADIQSLKMRTYDDSFSGQRIYPGKVRHARLLPCLLSRRPQCEMDEGLFEPRAAQMWETRYRGGV